MGNYSASAAATRREAVESLRTKSAERDQQFPKIERPCGTPGAVYSVTVSGNELGCVVTLPFSIEEAIPAEAKEEMKKALHDALLPIVEQFYRRVWTGTIAGKRLADDPEPMPKRWELLFAKWLCRCLERGETPTVDGKLIWGKYALPEAYRPSDFRWWPE